MPLVDREGRMPEVEGRRFYALMDFLALIVVPRIRQEQPINKNLVWDPAGIAYNPIETRVIVVDYILQNIESISREIDSSRHDALFRRTTGRRMTALDKSDIRSWKLHVSDDFFVVDHIPRKGSVLVQVGRLLGTTDLENELAYIRKEDVHEPRVFLVRGLATPFGEMCRRLVDDFRTAHPDIQHGDLPIALLNTTIIPYKGGLTYATNLTTFSQQYYATPASYAEAARIAVEAYRAAFSNAASDDAPRCLLYTNLTEKDTAICRLASSAENAFRLNVAHVNMLREEKHVKDRDSPNNTAILVFMMVWTPLVDVNDVRFEDLLLEAGFAERPLSHLQEGYKRQITQEILVADDEPCPFHQRMLQGKSYKDCCKNAQHMNTRQKGSDDIGVCLFNPVGKEEAVFIEKEAAIKEIQFWKYLRISRLDTCSVKVKVSPLHVGLIKERLDSAAIFHATNPEKWNYLGYIPVVMNSMGMMVFGDVTLESNGLLTCEGMTSERVEALILAMRDVCDGIPVDHADVVSIPYHKKKPDKEALARNVALVNDCFGKEASFHVDKKTFSMKECAYCASREEEKLRRCACKHLYYCSKEHQRMHWKIHKLMCSAAKK